MKKSESGNLRHFRALVIGGAIGAVLGYGVGALLNATEQGVGAGILLGWVFGETIGVLFSKPNRSA